MAPPALAEPYAKPGSEAPNSTDVIDVLPVLATTVVEPAALKVVLPELEKLCPKNTLIPGMTGRLTPASVEAVLVTVKVGWPFTVVTASVVLNATGPAANAGAAHSIAAEANSNLRILISCGFDSLELQREPSWLEIRCSHQLGTLSY